MKSIVLAASMLAVAASAGAQQAIDHSHMHDAAAGAQVPAQPPAAPQAPAPGQPPAAPGGGGGRGGPQIEVPWNDAVPPGTADHAMRALKESSRHGEWADIKMADGGVLKSWVVYPERAQKAGVVLVIHDIRGMSDMARALGDQLAQDGFIAIVPDFLSGKGPNGGGTESLGSEVGKTIQGLTPTDVVAPPERGDGAREEAAGIEWQDRGCRLLLGRRAQLRVCRGAAGARTPPSSTTATRRARRTAHRRPRWPT